MFLLKTQVHSNKNAESKIVSPHCAVALNQEVVPSSKLKQTKIYDGDNVEIVHAVGGGL